MQRILLITLVAMLLTCCHSSQKATGVSLPVDRDKENTKNLSGNWQLEMLFASDNNFLKQPFINIKVEDKTFSGNSGCNSISGKFSVNGSYLGIDKNFISTKMACADAKVNRDEKTFLSALLKVNRFTLVKDELELGQGEITLMKFRRRVN